MAQLNEISKFLVKQYQTVSEKYELLEQIDRGAFGDVMLARDVITNEKKAVKIMRLMENNDNQNIDEIFIKKLINEAALMSKLDHPHILKYDDCFQYNIYFCIVSEYCEVNLTKVLQRHIRERSRPNDELIYEWLYKLSKGLEYLHDKKVIHRDIKPSNILFKNNEIKIADFGESKDIMETKTKTTAQHGTLFYMPPEVLRRKNHTDKSDIWSLGCVFHEINYLELTFDGTDQYELEMNILNKKMKNFKIEKSKINDLIDNMICIDETKRFSIKQVLDHEYFVADKKDNNYQEIEQMIKDRFVNVNYKNEEGKTALIFASKNGHKDVVELLIKNNADVDARSNGGSTALIEASFYGHKDVVELLIKNNANVDASSNSGSTALIHASKNGHKDVVEFLIKNNADVDARSNSGSTALIEASFYGHKDVLELLIKNNANVDASSNSGSTALIHASKNGHKDIVELLIKNNANVDARINSGSTALIEASFYGHTDVVELLIKNNADVNTKSNSGSTALSHASKNGHKDVVELLIKNNANVDARINSGSTALIEASANNQNDVVELLKSVNS